MQIFLLFHAGALGLSTAAGARYHCRPGEGLRLRSAKIRGNPVEFMLSAGNGHDSVPAGILLVLAVSIYLWPLLALMDLKFLQLLKNSGLLFLGQFPRSAAALAILAGYIGLML